MFKISTKTLQDMTNRLSKCGSNKLLEITKYYHMVLDENGLVLTATDGTNFITVLDNTVKGDAIDTIVKADQFSKLVQRTSVETMSLELKENYLEVVGNGKYKVEIVEGETYPSYEIKDGNEVTVLNVADLKKVASTNKFSVSNTIADGVLTGYLMQGGKAITADGIKVCVTSANFLDADVLLTPEMISMIGALTTEKVSVVLADDKLLLDAGNTIIYGAQMEGIQQYPEIMPLTEVEFPSKCSLSKLAILNILDRLTLFIDPFEKNEILLGFSEKGLEVGTNSGSFEVIAYAHSENFAEFVCAVNGMFLKELVTAVDTELFELSYGVETLIKIESNGVIQLLATGEEEAE